MADTQPVAKRRYKNYFFLQDKLLKVMYSHKPRDILVAYDFSEHNKKTFVWSDVKRKKLQAFTVAEVAAMLGRHRARVWEWQRRGFIKPPHPAYTIGDPERKTNLNFYSEEDVMDIHEFSLTVHIGRPRNDGRITNNRLIDRETIRSLVKARRLLYIKDEDTGEFIPIWQERF